MSNSREHSVLAKGLAKLAQMLEMPQQLLLE